MVLKLQIKSIMNKSEVTSIVKGFKILEKKAILIAKKCAKMRKLDCSRQSDMYPELEFGLRKINVNIDFRFAGDYATDFFVIPVSYLWDNNWEEKEIKKVKQLQNLECKRKKQKELEDIKCTEKRERGLYEKLSKKYGDE